MDHLFSGIFGAGMCLTGPASVNEVGPIRRVRTIISTRRLNRERGGANVRGEGKPLKVNGLADIEVMVWLRKMTLQKSPHPRNLRPSPKETEGLMPSRERVERSETNSLGK